MKTIAPLISVDQTTTMIMTIMVMTMKSTKASNSTKPTLPFTYVDQTTIYEMIALPMITMKAAKSIILDQMILTCTFYIPTF